MRQLNQSTSSQKRIIQIQGTPWIAGYALGHTLGQRLETTIAGYIESVERRGALDMSRLQVESMPWFETLPLRYREECAGIAAGSGLTIERLAEWSYVEKCLSPRCSTLVGQINGRIWVARNNDYYAPQLWGYATVREITGRIPTLTFGMEGDPFTSTGINRERIWLHTHSLSGEPQSILPEKCLDSFVWLCEALETCASLADVERMLKDVSRCDSMLLFAVDGNTEESAIYECGPENFRRWPQNGAFLAGTNHRLDEAPNSKNGSTYSRKNRLEMLAKDLYTSGLPVELPEDLVGILKDPQIEQAGEEFGTVFSNIVCPSAKEIWYTFGGYPAASQGAWARIPWPFERQKEE